MGFLYSNLIQPMISNRNWRPQAIPDPFFGVYICIKWRQNVDWTEILYHNRILLDFWNRDLKSLKKRIILSEKALSWVNFLFSFYLSRCLYKGCSNYLTRLNYNCMIRKSTIQILLLSVCLSLFMNFLVSLKSTTIFKTCNTILETRLDT